MIFWDGHSSQNPFLECVFVTKSIVGTMIRHKINCWKGDSSQNLLLERGFVTKSIVGDLSQNLLLGIRHKIFFETMEVCHKIKIWNNGDSSQNQDLE